MSTITGTSPLPAAEAPPTPGVRRMLRWTHRVYSERGLPALLATARTAMLVSLVLLLALAMWGIGELDERGITTEHEDAVLTTAAILLVACIGTGLSRRLVSPLVDLQEARFREAMEHERAVREVLEHELAARQAFIEMANHHLRTPVTVIYGLTELLAVRGEDFEPDRRIELRRVVLDHAAELKDIVEDLSAFLDARVSEIATLDPSSR